MSQPPPPLPAEVLARVLRIATLDGRGIVILAGVSAVLSAAVGDGAGAVICVLAVGAGAMELQGCRLLRAGEARGLHWLVGCQLCVLSLILGYAWMKLSSYDAAWARTLVEKYAGATLAEAGVTLEEMLALVRKVYALLYVAVGVGAVVFQGGLALYYRSKRGVIAKALGRAAQPGAGGQSR